MKLIDDKPILFLGDHHGEYNSIFYLIKRLNIKDCYIIHVGDGGEGFISPSKQLRQFEFVNNFFKSHNIHYMSIRGNHSNPLYFTEKNRPILSNFELLEDYSTLEYQNKTIQLIGGAISIDRVDRVQNVSWWEGEKCAFDEFKCQKVDILVTHTAPSQCFPQQFSDIVYSFAQRDKTLLTELREERFLLDKILNKCNPSLHLYGHFHTSKYELINGCIHKALEINEFWELMQSS